MRRHRPAILRALRLAAALLLSGAAAATARADTPTPPRPYDAALATWRQRVDAHGPVYLEIVKDLTRYGGSDSFNHYDPLAVAWNNRALTGDPKFDPVIAAARRQYRDFWAFPLGAPIAYHAFSRGLRYDWERNPDRADAAKSRAALLNMAAIPSALTGPYNAMWFRSREVALALATLLDAEAVGAGPYPERLILTDHAINHVRQWFDPDSAEWPPIFAWCVPEAKGVQFFMVGLTLRSLIQAHEAAPDGPDADRILSAIRLGCDGLWRNYNPAWGAWPYWDRDTDPLKVAYPGNAGAYDGSGQPKAGYGALNPLIFPAFAYLAKVDRSPAWLARAEHAFVCSDMAGGMSGREDIWMGNFKLFNQALLWMDDWFRWRAEARKTFPSRLAVEGPPKLAVRWDYNGGLPCLYATIPAPATLDPIEITLRLDPPEGRMPAKGASLYGVAGVAGGNVDKVTVAETGFETVIAGKTYRGTVTPWRALTSDVPRASMLVYPAATGQPIQLRIYPYGAGDAPVGVPAAPPALPNVPAAVNPEGSR